MKKALRAILGALRSYGIGVGLFLVIVVMLLGGLSSTERASEQEQLDMLRDNIARAVVSCYALEGRYPESLDYLVSNYNVRIDESKFVVHYMIFGENIMPDVDVSAREVS
ncbi:MAG: hypothetical protein LBN99_00990 [Oscillospiraceae bacterium]|jgi:hypothetical protein|nr:hypothetical protein [Oscillospiraceae bacterium]